MREGMKEREWKIIDNLLKAVKLNYNYVCMYNYVTCIISN